MAFIIKSLLRWLARVQIAFTARIEKVENFFNSLKLYRTNNTRRLRTKTSGTKRSFKKLPESQLLETPLDTHYPPRSRGVRALHMQQQQQRLECEKWIYSTIMFSGCSARLQHMST